MTGGYCEGLEEFRGVGVRDCLLLLLYGVGNGWHIQ